jgi:hypothetical protein
MLAIAPPERPWLALLDWGTKYDAVMIITITTVDVVVTDSGVLAFVLVEVVVFVDDNVEICEVNSDVSIDVSWPLSNFISTK